MTWTAPDVDRPHNPKIADERTALEAWLDWHRATLLRKCAGLTGEQLAQRAVPPATLSLLGLLRHMTDVERGWFRIRFRGEAIEQPYRTAERPDAAFDDLDPARAEAEYGAYVAEIDATRHAAAGAGLDETFLHPRTGERADLRWVYLHLIEEYARHNGHADFLRQCIDGATGM